MKVAATFAESRSLTVGTVGLVPTMGYLHEGHTSLLSAASAENDTVLMSLFVNPLQFDEVGDLDRYPRDIDRDLQFAEDGGADVVFAPGVDLMYPPGEDTRVSLPSLASSMEGQHRRGHFEGVATVVARLFGGLQPQRAYFGRKDAQQLAIVRRMAEDLAFPIEIRGRPIVREADGLALSSRNVFLDESARDSALSLIGGLQAAADLAEAGQLEARALESIVATTLVDAGPGVEPDYVTLAARQDAAPLPRLDRSCFLAVAARVGGVRLIDNVHFDLTEVGMSVDRGVRLDRPSILYEES